MMTNTTILEDEMLIHDHRNKKIESITTAPLKTISIDYFSK